MICAALWALPVAGQELRIAADMPDLPLMLNGQEVVIARAEEGSVAACPPHCIQPIRAAESVETLGALEVIEVLRAQVAQKQGFLLDVRLPEAFATGHVPGAVNVPAPTLGADNPYLRDILLALGARAAGAGLDFDPALPLTIYGAGPAEDEAFVAVQALLAAGYPADRLGFFRGGMQEWLQFGLTMAEKPHEG